MESKLSQSQENLNKDNKLSEFFAPTPSISNQIPPDQRTANDSLLGHHSSHYLESGKNLSNFLNNYSSFFAPQSPMIQGASSNYLYQGNVTPSPAIQFGNSMTMDGNSSIMRIGSVNYLNNNQTSTPALNSPMGVVNANFGNNNVKNTELLPPHNDFGTPITNRNNIPICGVQTLSTDEITSKQKEIEIKEDILPKLQNIVSTADLKCTLDLRKIALQAKNAEYNPKRFAAVIMRIKEPKTTALIFASGKMVCTGAR